MWRESIAGGAFGRSLRRQFARRPRRRKDAGRLKYVEPLEARVLLSSDGLLPGDPALGLTLKAVDRTTFRPLAEVHAGEEFAVAVYARDLRTPPEGVFAAYLDLEYSDSMVEVSGPIDHGHEFTNGIVGSVIEPGLIDELGGFINTVSPPTEIDSQLVATIPFRAITAGMVTFTTNSADLFPNHESLLFGRDTAISTDDIDFGSLTLRVLEADPDEPRIDALDDDLVITKGSVDNRLNLLANDVSPNAPLSLLAIDTSLTRGEVTIDEERNQILYSPPSGYTGTDTFSYSAVDKHAAVDSATVTLLIRDAADLTAKAAVRLWVSDRWGNAVDQLVEGDVFQLHVGVEDLRSEPAGVFAAYLDVAYTSSLVDVEGALVFDGTLTNGISGELSKAGWIDDAGGFQMQLTPVGEGVHSIFYLPMRAEFAGRAVFQAGPPDLSPYHEILLFDEDAPIDPAHVLFERLDIEIIPRLTPIDDTYEIEPLTETRLAVLANDVFYPFPGLTVVSVDATDASGAVRISDDGQSLYYRPAAGFIGSEQFRYTVSDGLSSKTAEVTVHVGAVTLDDELAIRLEVTDRDGIPLSVLAAEDVFQVRAYIRDLRVDLEYVHGVFAAYLDLLYDAGAVTPVSSAGSLGGIEIFFGDSYPHVRSADGATSGIVDEVGAVQTLVEPLGTEEYLLFVATFQAHRARGVSDYFSVHEDAATELNVLANDSPFDGEIVFRSDPADRIPGNEILYFDPPIAAALNHIRYGSVSIPAVGEHAEIIAFANSSRHGGRVEIAPGGGGLIYIPPPDFTGLDTFQYSLGGGSSVQVQVNVLNVNDPPIAVEDSYIAPHGKFLSVNSRQGVLANDRDGDGDFLKAVLVEPPEHGQIELLEDGSFSFVPDAGFSGIETFSYIAADGELSSKATRVQIEVVPPPVRIRLASTDVDGQSIESLSAGDSLILQVYVQDTRDDSREDRGVGAAYVDVFFDADSIHPAPVPEGRFGFDVTFGATYQNANTGNVNTPGRVDNVGGLQSDFSPVGRGEEQLFAIRFETTGPRAEDDTYEVSKGSLVNVLDVLANESGSVWEVRFEARGAENSPVSDIVLFEPPQAVLPEDVQFLGTTVEIRNSSQLVVETVSSSPAGAVINVDAATGRVRYTPPAGFVGVDSFSYTIRDESGRRATGTVRVDVTESWTNELLPNDTNSDSEVTTIDALLVINDLNRNGPRQLPAKFVGNAFYDVNRDGHETALDALSIINTLNRSSSAEAEAASLSAVTLSSASEFTAVDWTRVAAWPAIPSESPRRVAGSRFRGDRAHRIDSGDIDSDLLDLIAAEVASHPPFSAW